MFSLEAHLSLIHISTSLLLRSGNITDHFATSGNRADCQSKESTQETLVSLVGMCCGVWLAKVLHRLEKAGKDDTCTDMKGEGGGGIPDTCANNEHKMVDVQVISWSIFIVLTLIHVWANYVGMQMLRLRTLNRERAKVAFEMLTEDCARWVMENQKKDSDATSKKFVIEKASIRVLPPTAVSESLWKSMYRMICPGNLQLGISLKHLINRTSLSSKHRGTACKWSQGHWDCENYMIFMTGSGCEKENNNHLCSIIVMLRIDATDCDELKAFLHAHILDWCLQNEANYESIEHSELLSRCVR